ncbi:Reverse transcriptase domain [Trinorchestia longiramus]|nr:Reverse transcriptase domain [Trinorchestia longiramus]
MVLSHIRKVAAGVGLSDVLLREYFTSRLPSHVQPFMVQFPDDKPLDELAALADKLFELSPEPPQSNIAIPVPIIPAPVTQVAPVVANPAVSAHSDPSLLGKLMTRRVNANTTSTPNITRLLRIYDPVTNLKFLTDTASSVSIIPATAFEKLGKGTNNLCAAFGTPIACFGSREITCSLGLRRNFNWKFIIAAVEQPIIVADFLYNFGLSVDLKNKLIRDETTSLSRPLSPVNITHSLHSIGAALDSKCKFQQILADYLALTNPNLAAKKNQSSTKHHIITTGPPVSSRARRLPPDRFETAKAEFQRMQNAVTVRISKSPWASPLMMVPKPNGEYRLCGDYRRLNAITIPDRFPIPHLQDFSANLHGATIFSKIDLAHAFHQIPMDEESIQKTAVITLFGLFEYTTMPYGLRNAPQTFQRHMTNILSDLPYAYTYLDDELIASFTPKQHEEHLRTLCERLTNHGLLIDPAKCELGKKSLTYLGHEISGLGLKPLPSKVQAIRNFPKPETKHELRRFLGSVNFYQRFIRNCAHILSPSSSLVAPKRRGKSTLIVWNTDASLAFETIKESLTVATELSYPISGAEFSLVVDASDVAVGAVLQQTVGSLTSQLSFFSRKLSPTEQRYSAFGKELLVIYLAVRHFRYILEARHFVVFTDHKPLVSAIHMPTDRHSPRESRHLSYISQFTTDQRYIKGSENTVADCLSRINCISIIPVLEQLTLESISNAQKEDPELTSLLQATQNSLRLVYLAVLLSAFISACSSQFSSQLSSQLFRLSFLFISVFSSQFSSQLSLLSVLIALTQRPALIAFILSLPFLNPILDHIPDHIPDHISGHILDPIFDHILDHYI